MLTFTLAFLIALFALREATSARIRREEGNTLLARKWRQARGWHDVAIAISALALLPRFITEPKVPFLDDAHSLLVTGWPLLLGLALIALIIGIRLMAPEIRRALDERMQDMRTQQQAQEGWNPPTPRELRNWLRGQGGQSFAPKFEYQFDQETSAGMVNILITTAEGRYAVYILPFAHYHRGFARAIKRCSSVASLLQARGILWIPDSDRRDTRQSTQFRAFVVHGAISGVFNLVEHLDKVSRRHRERKEERKRRQQEQKEKRVRWGSQDVSRAAERHDKERWERFARKAPIHPDMRDLIFRRHRGRCVVCGMTIDPGTPWHVRVTDYDHACRNSGTVRAIPHGAQVKERLPMPDCAQCHYEQPEHFESCVERLGPVHPMCLESAPPDEGGAVEASQGAPAGASEQDDDGEDAAALAVADAEEDARRTAATDLEQDERSDRDP